MKRSTQTPVAVVALAVVVSLGLMNCRAKGNPEKSNAERSREAVAAQKAFLGNVEAQRRKKVEVGIAVGTEVLAGPKPCSKTGAREALLNLGYARSSDPEWPKASAVVAKFARCKREFAKADELAARAAEAAKAAAPVPYLGDKSIGAYVMCQEFVTDRLKAPSTAEFSGFDGNVTSLGGNRYKVVGYVDAQNSFGAMLRSEFMCDLTVSGNDFWQPNDIIIK